MKFYRYETVEYAVHGMDGELVSPLFPNPKLELRDFDLIKETPKGYWIGGKSFEHIIWKKWMSKTSKRRYACPTEKEALDNFILRTEKRIKILDRQLQSCKIGLNLAKNKLL
jgi:hypothetical protein